MSRDHRWKISFSIIVGCLFGAAIYYIYNGFVQEFRYHLYADNDVQEAVASPLTNDNDSIGLSQFSDIDKRSQFQRKQIEKFCSKHSLSDFEYDRKELDRRIIFDDKHEVTFCLVPKNGNTNIIRLFLVSQGLLSLDTLSLQRVHYDEMRSGLKKVSLIHVHNNFQRSTILGKYYKMMMVRNPLERLLSGYRNKLCHNIKNTAAFPYNIIQEIMKRYRSDDYKKWLADTTAHYAITFSDFIQYVIDTPNKKLNVHFRPMISLCQPCTVKYDFYGAFKYYNEDTKVIIDRLNTNEQYRFNIGDHVAYRTEYFVYYYYDQVSQDLKEQLFRRFYNELEFYYYLYPEERNSHKLVLNVSEDIPVMTNLGFLKSLT